MKLKLSLKGRAGTSQMEKGGKIFQAKGIFTVTKARESSEFRELSVVQCA